MVLVGWMRRLERNGDEKIEWGLVVGHSQGHLQGHWHGQEQSLGESWLPSALEPQCQLIDGKGCGGKGENRL